MPPASAAPVALPTKVPQSGRRPAIALPDGFQDVIALAGLDHPTDFQFSPDGRLFVAEKVGQVKIFAGLNVPNPDFILSLDAEVNSYMDRGLMSLALAPDFPASPYLYLLYTYDAPPGQVAPVWDDTCPDPPGGLTNGCVVRGRLTRVQVDGDAMSGIEQVLIDGWCQQFPDHTVDALTFGPDGALYVAAGEGASYLQPDYGELGRTDGDYADFPLNPCGDPPTGMGQREAAPAAEGGSLRAQSLLRPPGQPVVLSGAILRIDRENGAALPDNPLAGSPDANAARIVAFGLRNPFRIAFRPGTRELWTAVDGADIAESIDRIGDPVTAGVPNFGWPCYEGAGPQPGFAAIGLSACENLYSAPGAVQPPYYSYAHSDQVVPGEACPSGHSALTGITFYGGGSYPPPYDGALFFSDYVRDCVWVMRAGGDGAPDRTTLATFVAGAPNPVTLRVGPDGDLFYLDHLGGALHRILYTGAAGGGTPGPTATVDPTATTTPLARQLWLPQLRR
jgi:glucose/arabinose dehydrogenase